MNRYLILAGVIAAAPIAVHLGLIAWRRTLSMSAALAELLEDDLGDFPNVPSAADVDAIRAEIAKRRVFMPQDSLWRPEPEHSHRSPLAGRRPDLRLFAAESPFPNHRSILGDD